jgi:hypothetical protein
MSPGVMPCGKEGWLRRAGQWVKVSRVLQMNFGSAGTVGTAERAARGRSEREEAGAAVKGPCVRAACRGTCQRASEGSAEGPYNNGTRPGKASGPASSDGPFG